MYGNVMIWFVFAGLLFLFVFAFSRWFVEELFVPIVFDVAQYVWICGKLFVMRLYLILWSGYVFVCFDVACWGVSQPILMCGCWLIVLLLWFVVAKVLVLVWRAGDVCAASLGIKTAQKWAVFRCFGLCGLAMCGLTATTLRPSST